MQLNGSVMSPQAQAQWAVLLQRDLEPENSILEPAAGGAKPIGFACGPFLEDTLGAPTKSR